MSWIKIALCGLVICFCMLLGYFAAEKYRARRKFFSSLALFNERYLNELNYRRRPLPVFLAETKYSGEFGKCLEQFSEKRTLGRLPFLDKEEQALVADYLSMLGKGDAHAQLEYFGSLKGTLNTKKEVGEREAKSRGELYLKLGLLSGLAFVILII